MMRPLMWFRSDLRVCDNTALSHACRAPDEGVVGVYALCPSQWRQHDWGVMKVDFILRNLKVLSRALAKLGIPLLIVRADTFKQLPDKLLRLATRHRCDALYFNEEYEVNERRRDREVAALFAKYGRCVCTFTDQVILDVSQIRTRQGGYFTAFTPFKRRWCEAYKSGAGASICPAPLRQRRLNIEPDEVPERLKGFAGQTRADLWPAGEKHARTRLREFVEKQLGTYHKTRDFPAVNSTSMLSPYLAAGVISPRQCLEAALAANRGRLNAGHKGATTWISELIWREFYRHVLIGYPRVGMSRAFKPETEELPWRYDERQFQAWCEGRTGFPLVDAGMRQLLQTGWMHNRLRMIVAMFLTKDLFVDWRWGERHFMLHLVDGDFASNNGGWQWSASTGTDAVPYFRIFNPYNQSRRFDPEGEFIRQYVPELRTLDRDAIHEPATASTASRKRLDYPPPICDHSAARQQVLEAFKRLAGRSRGGRGRASAARLDARR